MNNNSNNNNNKDNEKKKNRKKGNDEHAEDAEEAAVADGEGEVEVEVESGKEKGPKGDNKDGNKLFGWDTRYQPIRVPAKKYDGGMNAQDRQLLHQMEVDVGSAAPSSSTTTTATATATAANDSFQTFSNIDTRMRELLGLGPVANPNDADQQEDWRQLTGFLGLGGRRGQRGNNGNQENNAAAEGEAQQQQQAANQGGNDGGTSPERRTRLSYELHLNAFLNMWEQRGELPDVPEPENDGGDE